MSELEQRGAQMATIGAVMPHVDGEKLAELREERFLSHRELAKLAGVSPQTVLNPENSLNRGATMSNTNGHGPEPERVALYLRVSSEEQRDAGTIQTQSEFLEGYCHLHSLEVVDTYADDGVSGTVSLPERPAGRRLLEDALGGKFGVVLVYRLDRLGRALLVVV